MGVAKLLRREKTNPPTVGTVYFYSNSTYVPVYGKTRFLVGGTGAPGGANTGGVYEYTTPSTGGNLEYTPIVPPKLISYTPAVYSTTVSIQYQIWGRNPTGSGSSGDTNPYVLFAYPPSLTYTYETYNTSYDATNPVPSPLESFPIPSFTDPRYPGILFYFYETYGTYVSTLVTPAKAVYSPQTGGQPYYTPIVPGVAVYSPIVVGPPSSAVTVLGVNFPGTTGGLPGVTVTPTAVSLSYTPQGVPINVPPGGAVTITNVQSY